MHFRFCTWNTTNYERIQGKWLEFWIKSKTLSLAVLASNPSFLLLIMGLDNLSQVKKFCLCSAIDDRNYIDNICWQHYTVQLRKCADAVIFMGCPFCHCQHHRLYLSHACLVRKNIKLVFVVTSTIPEHNGIYWGSSWYNLADDSL